jgi:mono/diheme cytochrome c family protein
MARYPPPIHCRWSRRRSLRFYRSPAVLAQNATNSSSESTLSAGFKFAGKSGAELYASVCQGCHMPDGKGATGAGAYPSIAGNETLKASGYMLDIVVNGKRAMPPLGDMMNDDQVAAVVNYVRTHSATIIEMR